ncbi:MAG: hypothetical protein JWQ46_2100 [Phenylobacterium sp.]|jgi:hypothetical protein|nr:hypothetical protein [Phenylobacterium sp.]
MGILSWLRTASVSDADVRSEVWLLGVRHHGFALEGAQQELKAQGVSFERAELLRACIRKLRG